FVARLVRHDPNLQQMDRCGGGGVHLAVADSPPRAHALAVTWPNHRAGAQAVPVFKGTFEHVSNDFHVAMGMSRKAFPRRNYVLVNDPQGAEAHEAWIVVLIEGESMPSIEPAVVAAASFVRLSNVDHDKSSL